MVILDCTVTAECFWLKYLFRIHGVEQSLKLILQDNPQSIESLKLRIFYCRHVLGGLFPPFECWAWIVIINLIFHLT